MVCEGLHKRSSQRGPFAVRPLNVATSTSSASQKSVGRDRANKWKDKDTFGRATTFESDCFLNRRSRSLQKITKAAMDQSTVEFPIASMCHFIKTTCHIKQMCSYIQINTALSSMLLLSYNRYIGSMLDADNVQLLGLLKVIKQLRVRCIYTHNHIFNRAICKCSVHFKSLYIKDNQTFEHSHFGISVSLSTQFNVYYIFKHNNTN